ncbi:hypothetical protein BU26DRAFT_32339 [Trematosphaeria pertusa]|uniref:Uncharacterized protein n=1 Tax=Trematosphaeria pertusa TaxID=390896 RepID=A0A6A6J408_9PLEO|nr:uncharacterized protein BU26DRAFT_32339 [Trematosphaeria pertusa]KAF2256942.1 hypothetical protein BU26DRAFT_32339 [Trematosphaeria pertusa]
MGRSRADQRSTVPFIDGRGRWVAGQTESSAITGAAKGIVSGPPVDPDKGHRSTAVRPRAHAWTTRPGGVSGAGRARHRLVAARGSHHLTFHKSRPSPALRPLTLSLLVASSFRETSSCLDSLPQLHPRQAAVLRDRSLSICVPAAITHHAPRRARALYPELRYICSRSLSRPRQRPASPIPIPEALQQLR